MVPQFLKAFIADSNLTAYQAVILSDEGHVDLGGSANSPIIGFVVNDCSSGDDVTVHMCGPVFKGIGGDTSFAAGDYVMLEGTDGRLKKYADDNSLQHACGVALQDGADGKIVEVMLVAFKAETALA